MKFHKIRENYKNCIAMLLTIIVNIVIMSLVFDFYYDLNDDVMMKDIMAGVYTGIPDGHNMQTLYILGAFISLWYRLFRGVPWYGLFLFLCQFGCLYLIGIRILRLCEKRLAKMGCLIVLTIFMWGTVLGHLLAIQYTVTCAILAATAIFLFMTTEKEFGIKGFVMQNIPSILLVILAYQLRTEMLLLVFPLIALAGLYSFAEEEKVFSKKNFWKYGIVVGTILTGMLISGLIDFVAYGSGEWKEFRAFFRYRTEVYDFHYDILTSGNYREELSGIGTSDVQQTLLANYNFGLDEDIDAVMLEKIASFGAEQTAGTAFAGKLFEKGRYYIYRIFHTEDAPYNLLVLAVYFCIAVFGIYSAVSDKRQQKRWFFIWELGLLALVRTLLWMYILMRDRNPERITHSLYLAELAVLFGLLVMKYLQSGQWALFGTPGKGRKVWKTSIGTAAIFCGLISFYSLPDSIKAAIADKGIREEANQGCIAIAQYCKAHPENFYFEDVYSTVGFSQTIFQNVDNSMANYDIMGGWMCKSPLYRKKIKQFGIAAAEEGLLHGLNVYFIAETGTPGSDISWMQDYYEEKGVTVRLEQVDSIEDKYAVYQVEEQSGS